MEDEEYDEEGEEGFDQVMYLYIETVVFKFCPVFQTLSILIHHDSFLQNDYNNKKKKVPNVLTSYGNERTMNLNSLVLTNIQVQFYCFSPTKADRFWS